MCKTNELVILALEGRNEIRPEKARRPGVALQIRGTDEPIWDADFLFAPVGGMAKASIEIGWSSDVAWSKKLQRTNPE